MCKAISGRVTAKIVDCKNRTPEYFDDGEYFVVRTSNVKNGVLINQGRLFTNYKNFKKWTERGIPVVGSVLFTREAPAGEACIVPDNTNLCLGQRMMSIDGQKETLDNQFLLNLIYSKVVQTYVELKSAGSTVSHLRVPQVYDLPIVIPPIQEQKEIVKFLNLKKIKINKAINLKQKQIAALKEYKTTLINAAVTGKVKIPGT